MVEEVKSRLHDSHMPYVVIELQMCRMYQSFEFPGRHNLKKSQTVWKKESYI